MDNPYHVLLKIVENATKRTMAEIIIIKMEVGGFSSLIIKNVVKVPARIRKKITIRMNKILRYFLSNALNDSCLISGKFSGIKTEFEKFPI